MEGMGLIYYLPSLLKVCSRSADVRLGLPAHQHEISDIKGRALEIVYAHHERLSDLLSLLESPVNLYDLSDRYFSEVEGKELKGYDRVLAIEEISAHVEYLIENLNCAEIVNPLDREKGGVLLYQRI